MPRKEINHFQAARGESPQNAQRRFEEDESPISAMRTKQRLDDDLHNIPAVESSIDPIDGRAHFFIGKGDRVVIKLDKEFPEVPVAAEDVAIGENQRVLVLNSDEGFIGIALAALHPTSHFYLHDAHLGEAALSQRNVEANHEIARNLDVISEDRLEQILTEGVPTIVYRLQGFIAVEYIHERMAAAHKALLPGGELFIITHKKSGAERHEKILREVFGSVEVVGRGKGGFRVFKATKNSESTPDINIKTPVAFDVLNQTFNVTTEPGLFSKDDLDKGTRLLLEQVDLSNFQNLLDIGSSWGAIGLVAATINPDSSVMMTDIDTHAIKVAQENIANLNLGNRVKAIATADIHSLPGNFDLILSNPPFHIDTHTLTGIFKAAKDKLAKNGQLYIVVEQTYVAKLKDILDSVFGRSDIYHQDDRIKFTILRTRK